MEFERFEEKRLRTLHDRGLDFRDARDLFDGRTLYTYSSPRGDEARFVSVGIIGQQCFAVVWMDRGGARRIISMRRARHGEKANFSAILG
ncbi:MAG: BrnT family toxin [Rhodospirillales bacterium]